MYSIQIPNLSNEFEEIVSWNPVRIQDDFDHVVIGLALHMSKTHLIIHDSSSSFSITIHPKTHRHRFFLSFLLKGKGKNNKRPLRLIDT